MKCLQPDYVSKFQCDGRACEARCCRDWRIVVDDDTYEKFAALPEIERAGVLDNLDWVNDESAGVDVMVLKLRRDGVCSFLREDSLCGLQKKYGEGFLTAICQSFPRVTYKLADELFEQSMTLTCPLAAQLVLFSPRPIRFVEVPKISARAVIGFKKKLSRPVEQFVAAQLDAIKILQNRLIPINQRLKDLCAMFAKKPLPDVEFDAEAHAEMVIEIFDATYNASLDDFKKIHLRENYLNYRDEILTQIGDAFGHLLENYLVNEFFLRCYPSAFSGGEFHNCKIFIAGYRVLEFAIALTVISKIGLGLKVTVGDVANLMCAVNDLLDHSRGGMDAIVEFAKTCSAETFAALMLDD